MNRRVRRVRKRKGSDLKPHVEIVVNGQNTERIKQQLAQNEKVSWEGEYRDD